MIDKFLNKLDLTKLANNEQIITELNNYVKTQTNFTKPINENIKSSVKANLEQQVLPDYPIVQNTTIFNKAGENGLWYNWAFYLYHKTL